MHSSIMTNSSALINVLNSWQLNLYGVGVGGGGMATRWTRGGQPCQLPNRDL